MQTNELKNSFKVAPRRNFRDIVGPTINRAVRTGAVLKAAAGYPRYTTDRAGEVRHRDLEFPVSLYGKRSHDKPMPVDARGAALCGGAPNGTNIIFLIRKVKRQPGRCQVAVVDRVENAAEKAYRRKSGVGGRRHTTTVSQCAP